MRERNIRKRKKKRKRIRKTEEEESQGRKEEGNEENNLFDQVIMSAMCAVRGRNERMRIMKIYIDIYII